jgi:hypothetical protein
MRGSVVSTSDPYRIEQLGKASRRAAVLSLLGFLIVLVSLAYSAYELRAVNRMLSAKKTEVNGLQRQEAELREKVSNESSKYNNLKANIEKLYSVQVTPQNEVYEVKATAQATGKVTNNLAEYRFAIYINSPTDVLNKIAKVIYTFDHPSFSHPVQEITDGTARFTTQYVGWGCLDNVGVKILLKDGTERSIDFDMCKSLGQGWQ